MEKRTKSTIALIFIVLVVVFVLLFSLGPFFAQKVYAESFTDLQLKQVPDFSEFRSWFGKTARGKQIFEATQSLLKELSENPRDLQGVAEGIKCPFTEDQRQDVISVAIAYHTLREICILRSELKKLSPGLSKDEFMLETARLESLLNAELKKILDGQARVEGKLDLLQKAVDDLVKKAGILDDLLEKSKEQIGLLKDILALLKKMDGKIDIIDGKIDKVDGKIDQLLFKKSQTQPQEIKPQKTFFAWPKEKEKIEPKPFWFGVGAIGQKKVYGILGFVEDNFIHTRAWIPIYLEGGFRKFLIKDFLAAQIFGGYGSAGFIGVGLVGYIQLLDMSVSAGAQYFSKDLIGWLEPVQLYLGLSHEGRWTRMILRVIPNLNMVQLTLAATF